jgi:hypothetical protein
MERLLSQGSPSRLGDSALPLSDTSGFMESMYYSVKLRVHSVKPCPRAIVPEVRVRLIACLPHPSNVAVQPDHGLAAPCVFT